MLNQELIKEAFLKVKKDILILEKENLNLKNQIMNQNEVLFKIKGVLSEILNTLKELKEAKKEVSSGNEGVNQSINHLINQSINQSNINQSFNQSNEQPEEQESSINIIKPDFKPDNNTIPNITPNHLINQSNINQSFNQSINHLINQSDPNFLALRTNLEGIFRLLSKQELKLFLTIYQLEDEGKEPFYTEISSRMGLSEHCIRSHLFSLFRKNAPLYKKRLNNKRNIIHIKPDFKALNLKQKLIGIYYDSDPHQTTLFDI